jgi:hypothetical protein
VVCLAIGKFAIVVLGKSFNHKVLFIQVTISIERYLSLKIKKWRILYFKPIEAFILSIAIGIFICSMNLTLVLFIDYDMKKTNTTCFLSDNFIVSMRVFNRFLSNIIIFFLIKINSLRR